MICTMAELTQKNVVCICDGAGLGCVDDVEIDIEKGVVCALLIYGKKKWFGPPCRNIRIPWDCIKRIGNENILVEKYEYVERPVKSPLASIPFFNGRI